MCDKIYLCFFILCGILCQAIIEVTTEDVEESNRVVRRKRVINLEEISDIPLRTGDAPFVVNIRNTINHANIGVGTILSRHTVITSASSVAHLPAQSIQVRAGSSYSIHGYNYKVINKKLHLGGHQQRYWEGVALLTVEPRIRFGGNSQPIPLHEGVLLAGTLATIFGWGCNPKAPRGTKYLLQLRAITVPIMRHQDCVEVYRDVAGISDKDICTYDANKRCGHTDNGAPLVVDNHLAGVHIWKGNTPGNVNPDVFVVVQHLEYSQWIRNNTVDQ